MLNIRTKPEDLLKGRRTLSPEEYGAWIAAVHDIPPDEVEYDPDTDLIWYKRKFDWDHPATGYPDLLHDPRPTWKPERKRVKTMGHSLRSFADLAVLTRAWRKPKYKSLRYLYVKNGVIVEYERTGRRVPAKALSLAGNLEEDAKHIKERINALGADSFFTVHNHYSGYSTPSAVDRKFAAVFRKVAGLKGHIISNPCSFGLITVKGLAILRVLPDYPSPSIDPVTGAFLNPAFTVDHELLEIIAWANALTGRKRPVVVSIREETVLRELNEISLDMIDTWNRLVDIMATKYDDLGFRGPSLDEAGPLLRHGGLYHP